MSVMTTGPPGTATTASSESAGALPPDAVATITDWPRARPFKTPPGENEATKGFLLANVTVGFGIVLPSASFTTTSMLGRPPTSKITGFGAITNDAGAGDATAPPGGGARGATVTGAGAETTRAGAGSATVSAVLLKLFPSLDSAVPFVRSTRIPMK